FFRLLLRLAPPPTPFPYTTLFRSIGATPTARSSCRPVSPTSNWNIVTPSPLPAADRFASTMSFFALCRRQAAANGTRSIQFVARSEEHTSELQSRENLVCRLLLEK